MKCPNGHEMEPVGEGFGVCKNSEDGSFGGALHRKGGVPVITCAGTDPAQEGESLKLRLERIKRRGNLALDLLERWGNGRPVSERYFERSLCIHVHIVHMPTASSLCLKYLAGPVSPIGGVAQHKLEEAIHYGGVIGQVPVLVWVGDVAQRLSPLASECRLEILNSGNVDSAKALEPVLVAIRKVLAVTVHGELRSFMSGRIVVGGELEHEVIQGGAEVVDDFSREDGEGALWRSPSFVDDGSALGLRIECIGQILSVCVAAPFLPTFEVGEVFTGPLDSEIGPVQWMHSRLPRVAESNRSESPGRARNE